MEKKTYKAGDVQITKLRLVREVNNDKCHNFYWCADVRLFVTDSSFYRSRFVVWYDSEDVAEAYPDKTRITKKDLRDYATELAWSFLGNIGERIKDEKSRKAFYADCRETIENYNDLAA